MKKEMEEKSCKGDEYFWLLIFGIFAVFIVLSLVEKARVFAGMCFAGLIISLAFYKMESMRLNKGGKRK